jgi:TatD DNase family protein
MPNKPFLIDSHCHLDRLDLKAFDGDLDAALNDARANGVGHMLCVCIDLDNFKDVIAIARANKDISASVGIHPNDEVDHEPSSDELIKLAQDPEVVAIGETGLDYFRSKGDLEWQRDRFRQHIAAGKGSNKPLIIHTREARDDTLKVMQEENAADIGGVMHCFTEDWDMAKQALDMNFYISFSGIVTFKSAQELMEVAKQVPEDRILIETDSPYLAPVPYRGKTNYPAYVRYVAEHIANLRGTTLEHIAEVTTNNYHQLFG